MAHWRPFMPFWWSSVSRVTGTSRGGSCFKLVVMSAFGDSDAASAEAHPHGGDGAPSQTRSTKSGLPRGADRNDAAPPSPARARHLEAGGGLLVEATSLP